MIEINLLSKEIVQRKKIKAFVGFVSICALVSLAICALWFVTLTQEVSRSQDRLKSTKEKVRQYQPTLEEIKKYQGEISQVQSRLNAIENLTFGQSAWARILLEISRALPEDVWLKKVNEIKVEEIRFLSIEGFSLDQTLAVANFMENLSYSPLFEDTRFYNLTREETEGIPVMQFRISCRLTGFVPDTGVAN